MNTSNNNNWTKAYLESLNKKIEKSRQQEKPNDTRRQEQGKNEVKKPNKISKSDKKKNQPPVNPQTTTPLQEAKKKQNIYQTRSQKSADHFPQTQKIRPVGGTLSRIEGDTYWVTSGNQVFSCKARFSKLNVKELYIGDHVHVLPDPGKGSWIEKVDARQNLLANPIQKGQTTEKILAVNVNQVLIVVSVKEPVLRPDWLDRHLIVFERRGFKPVICCTKIDLAEDNQFMEILNGYGKIGYKIVYVSSLIPSTIMELKSMLKNKKTLLTGHIGVGKTTLFRWLTHPYERKEPIDLDQMDWSQDEDYTPTDTVQAVNLEIGGMIIDTPGILEYDIGLIPKKDLKKYYREFRPYNGQCSVSNCQHTDEPFCAVRQAVDEQIISQDRYDSYLKIFENLP